MYQPTASRITGIFQTQDEGQARRVLQIFTQEPSLHVGFTYKDGFYEILTDSQITEAEATRLNRLAHNVANTDIKAQHLGAFQQWEAM